MADNTLKKIDTFSFSLKDVIGIGSFGKVFKGKSEKTHEQVAVKMMDKRKIQNDEYLMQGLFSEIQVMKKLKSQHVVELIEVLETSNNYYIIQEFCDGGDFRHILKKRKHLPEEEALSVLEDLLTGFTELLKHGIIHRDLKPENILNSQGKFKLADFGFARTVDNFKKQMLESLVGTPLYMSPQILKHETYTTKSDIWSLALIYYEMLFGQTPWQARSQYELVQKIENQQISFPDTVQISQLSKDFITSCLQINEDQRISWDDIFKHKLFQGHFSDYIQQRGELENKANFIINNLRQKIFQERMDLEILFQRYGLQQKSKMNTKEFMKMMMEIDNTLTRQQIEYIFNKFDTNGDLTIDFDEFKEWLEQNNVRMSMRGSGQQDSVKRIPTQHVNQEIEEKALNTISKLIQLIQQSNINLALLFNRIEKAQSDTLELSEFGKILKKIDQDITDEEIQAAFKKFDVDGDGKITFKEFCDTLQQKSQNMQNFSQTNYSTNTGNQQIQQPVHMQPNSNNIGMNMYMQPQVPFQQQQQMYMQPQFQQQMMNYPMNNQQMNPQMYQQMQQMQQQMYQQQQFSYQGQQQQGGNGVPNLQTNQSLPNQKQ